jgi:hypothetical protein
MPSSYPRPLPLVSSRWPAFLTDGLLSAASSAAALVWRGRRERGSAAAPLNAVSHILRSDAALARNDVSLRYTATGAVLHVASALLWGGLYAWLRHRRRRPTAGNAVGDAVAVSAVASLVDFKVVPARLTPGFEHRLSRQGLAWVYVALAAGLALGGLKELSDDRRR